MRAVRGARDPPGRSPHLEARLIATRWAREQTRKGTSESSTSALSASSVVKGGTPGSAAGASRDDEHFRRPRRRSKAANGPQRARRYLAARGRMRSQKSPRHRYTDRLAQLGGRLLDKQDVTGSSPRSGPGRDWQLRWQRSSTLGSRPLLHVVLVIMSPGTEARPGNARLLTGLAGGASQPRIGRAPTTRGELPGRPQARCRGVCLRRPSPKSWGRGLSAT